MLMPHQIDGCNLSIAQYFACGDFSFTHCFSKHSCDIGTLLAVCVTDFIALKFGALLIWTSSDMWRVKFTR
ncbi:facilitated glucose transporter member,Solute carrier family 2 [Trichinella spiralis]|uniref:Facilitated glucose transporter member,Solute carrier family 2 n=1 Tax=Trichinella spiralis TaxID=6334 RepID=A0ABR3KLY4_TRISP